MRLVGPCLSEFSYFVTQTLYETFLKSFKEAVGRRPARQHVRTEWWTTAAPAQPYGIIGFSSRMPHHFTRRPSQIALSTVTTTAHRDREMDNHHLHFDASFGDYLESIESEPYLRSDPEVESVRSHPSSHLDADQTLLPHSPAAIPARAQTQRLQRRRNQYYYSNGLLVPVPTTTTPHSLSPADQRPTISHQSSPHKRAKSYTVSGTASSWLLGGSSAFADVKRQSWTGERREIRKLQKDHPVGSARPSSTVEIGDDSAVSTGAAGTAAERDGAKGSVLGVRRKMEKLRGFYRRGEKDVMVSSNLR